MAQVGADRKSFIVYSNVQFEHGVESSAPVPKQFVLIIVEFIKFYQNTCIVTTVSFGLRKNLLVKPEIVPSFKPSAPTVQSR
jgi:hypothetical protein